MRYGIDPAPRRVLTRSVSAQTSRAAPFGYGTATSIPEIIESAVRHSRRRVNTFPTSSCFQLSNGALAPYAGALTSRPRVERTGGRT